MNSVYLLIFLTIPTYASPHHGKHHNEDLVETFSSPWFYNLGQSFYKNLNQDYDYNENDYETEYQTPEYQEYLNASDNEEKSSSGYDYNDEYNDKIDFSNPCPYLIHT